MPPLFLCCFDNADGDKCPLLVDAPTWEAAALRVLEETDESPLMVHPAPPGLLCCEVRFADDGTKPNPADDADEGVALSPFEAFADWLHDVDEAEPPPVDELAAKDPTAEELAETSETPAGGTDAPV